MAANRETGIVQYAIVEFPGSEFNGEIAPALQELVDRELIRIIDVAFVRKDEDGSVVALELDALPPVSAAPFDGVDGEILGLLSDEDITALASGLDPDSTSAILVWENLWSARLAQAVRDSNGLLAAHGTVEAGQVAAALAASAGGK
jgi:hypothetical protein